MNYSKDFFKRETICGFEVPEMMKRAWAAEMEILEAVMDICDRNGLQYFADGGTLLGAVRHQGFIPWDDDIDLGMKREDYMKLVQILPRELPPGMAMAGMYAETERMRRLSFHSYIKVVSDVQYWDFQGYMKRFHGFPYPKLAIDVFPFDYIPRDPEARKIQSLILSFGFYVLDNWEKCKKAGELEEILSFLEKLCNTAIPRNKNTQNDLWKLMDQVSVLYREDEADEMACHYYLIQNPGQHFQKDCFKSTIPMQFEQMSVPAPCGWQQILSRTYGDFMAYDRDAGRGHTYPFYGYLEDELVKGIQALGFSGTVEEFCQKVSGGEMRVPESGKMMHYDIGGNNDGIFR